jgi:KRAB domain-containing zinc finger protein
VVKSKEHFVIDEFPTTDPSEDVQCFFCSEMFPTVEVKEHMLKIHGRYAKLKYGPQRPFKCHNCNASLEKELKDTPGHVCFVRTKPKKKGEPHACEVCGHKFPQLRKLLRHMQSVHNDQRPFECTHCVYTAKTNTELDNHTRRNHNKEKNVVCGVCGKQFFETSDLRIHNKSRHTPKLIKTDWPCDTCGKMFNSKRAQSSHQKIHLHGVVISAPIEKIPCETCGQGFPTKYSLKYHSDWEHPSQDVVDKLECICHKCNLNFPRAQTLNEHLAHCLEEPKAFECQACIKSDDLHERSDYVWHSAIALKKHVAEVHHIIRVVCDICGKVMKTKLKATLQDHKRLVHSGIGSVKKDWSCDMCEKMYGSKLVLGRHMLAVHNKNKCFTCDYCDKIVRSLQSLRTHMATVHYKKIEYNCHLCGHKAINKQALRGHVRRVHEKSLPTYSCIICNKDFSQRVRLMVHMAKNHATTATDM